MNIAFNFMMCITTKQFTRINIIIVNSLIFAIYFSTAFTVILSIVLFFFWLIEKKYSESLIEYKNNVATKWAMILFIYLAIGITYSTMNLHNAIFGLSKYRELLLLFILPAFFRHEQLVKQTWRSIIFLSLLTMIGSYAIYFGLIKPFQPYDPTIKSRITHSLFISFFAFYCLHQSWIVTRLRIVYLILFIICVHNLFFIVSGRTGQLNFLGLMLLFSWQRLSIKQRIYGLIGLSLFCTIFMLFSDQAIRIIQGISEVKQFFTLSEQNTETSMGLRLTYWQNAIDMIKDKPILGHGTGSYVYHYLQSNHLMISANPHNEYLMIMVQLGIVGLSIFLIYLYTQYKYSLRLIDEYCW
ncbi:MAG: hypothetical protein RL637_367, partial [Pseudomonadota bacterium]